MNDDQRAKAKDFIKANAEAHINSLSHLEMAKIWRNAPSNHPYIQDPELFALFKTRFDAFGGMTPSMSKKLCFSINH